MVRMIGLRYNVAKSDFRSRLQSRTFDPVFARFRARTLSPALTISMTVVELDIMRIDDPGYFARRSGSASVPFGGLFRGYHLMNFTSAFVFLRRITSHNRRARQNGQCDRKNTSHAVPFEGSRPQAFTRARPRGFIVGYARSRLCQPPALEPPLSLPLPLDLGSRIGEGYRAGACLEVQPVLVRILRARFRFRLSCEVR